MLPSFEYKTNTRIDTVTFSEHNILSIIRSLNQNKAHGWDNVSTRMIQICDDSIILPLAIIFKTALNSGIYPDQWKKANVVPVHKKDSKNLLKNYRPISLLPICEKIFEKCIYDTLYTYFESNSIFSPCQSGFRKEDSCVSPLLAITHNIFSNFDANPPHETRGVFLDISKAFDRVWHEGLLHKLKSYGVNGPLLSLIKSFLENRMQRVVLNGQTSSWKHVLAGVPQGSILGPLFFLVYINDIPDGLQSIVKIFADDTSLFKVLFDYIISSSVLDSDLRLIANWAFKWKMLFNPDPSKQALEIIFSTKLITTQPPILTFNNSIVSSKESHKHLGMILDKKLSFDHHLREKIAKANKGIGLIKRLYNFLPRLTLINIYKCFIRPHLDYGDIIYDKPNNDTFCQKIESVQYNASLAITGAIRGTSREKLYQELGLESLSDRRWSRRLCFYYKIKNNKTPSYLKTLLPKSTIPSYNLRISKSFTFPNPRTDRFRASFFPFCATSWDQIDPNIQHAPSLMSFKHSLLQFIRPTASPVYHVHHPRGLKLLTRLCLGFSHLREHKFCHNFQDTINPFCLCKTNDIETNEHFLLHCPNYSTQRLILFDNFRDNGIAFLPLNSSSIVKLFLYGCDNHNITTNKIILFNVIEFIIQSKRFDEPFM